MPVTGSYEHAPMTDELVQLLRVLRNHILEWQSAESPDSYQTLTCLLRLLAVSSKTTGWGAFSSLCLRICEQLEPMLRSGHVPTSVRDRLWNWLGASLRHIKHPADIESAAELLNLEGLVLGERRYTAEECAGLLSDLLDEAASRERLSDVSHGAGVGHLNRSEMKRAARRRRTMESDLRRALDHGEFELYYQPKACIQTGRLVASEALVRWHCPARGWVAPADFIPIAEESGLILPLGEWVLDEACRQARVWREQNQLAIAMAVNFSPVQMRVRHPFASLERILQRHAIPPQLLEIEITESAAMHDPEHAVHSLLELTRMGVHLAVDDFGTGYSNLSRLRRLPISTIKVDCTLITGIATYPQDAAIVRAVIELVHTLGARVVAEGVETAEQLSVLKMARCDGYQGYLLAKPMAASEFVAWADQQCSRSLTAEVTAYGAGSSVQPALAKTGRRSQGSW